MHNLLQRFRHDIARAIAGGHYRQDDGGLLLMRDGSLRVAGFYREGIAGQPESFRMHHNLVPDAALLHYLSVVLCAGTQITAWYLAPYGNNATPLANWTGANFTANSGEITSTVEGFSETTRQSFTPGTPASGAVDNSASKATFSIVCTSTLNIYGAGLLSSSVRGGTTGVLLSAVKFDTLRVANNGDPWQCEYIVDAANG